MHFYGNPGDYWILDTDFTSFSSVYSCSTVAGVARYELAFVLTRDRFPSNATVRESYHRGKKYMQRWTIGMNHGLPAFQIEKALDAFNRNNLTLDWYPIPQFDDCLNDPPGNCKEDFP